MDNHSRNPYQAKKGRGAVTNATGRFEAHTRHEEHDGWESDGWDPLSEDLPPFRTQVTEEHPKSIISRNQSPDLPFYQSINPYRGCEHGCIYCYARPSHAYAGLSPGLDFESKLFAKVGAAEALKRELAKPSYECSTIMLGANTDPYQPIERDWKVTRDVLEVLSDCDHPVAITTKSASVLNDLDILSDMAARRLVSVGMSVTTLDRNLARIMEPRASTPARRLDAIEGLTRAGIPVTVMASPMIPQLNDQEMEAILEAAVKRGATNAAYIMLRLPREIKGLFTEWLETHVPDRAARVLNHIRSVRGGELYDSNFTTRMKGTGEYARLMASRFNLACKRLNINKQEEGGRFLDKSGFTPPVLPGSQLNLF